MTTRIKLLTDHVNFETDINSCEERTRYDKQNFQATLYNYIQMMTEHLDILTTINDSLTIDEMKLLTLKTNNDRTALILDGDEQILERFLGFGIAMEYNSDDDSQTKSEIDSEAESESISGSISESESESEYESDSETETETETKSNNSINSYDNTTNDTNDT